MNKIIMVTGNVGKYRVANDICLYKNEGFYIDKICLRKGL